MPSQPPAGTAVRGGDAAAADHAAARAWTQDMHGFGSGRSIGMPASSAPAEPDVAAGPLDMLTAAAAVDAQSVVLGLDAPVMALVGADAGYLGADLGGPAWAAPGGQGTGRAEQGDGRRATRRGIAEANAAAPEGGDDRSARRGRSFSGPAAARALGSKISAEDGGSSGRGSDRGRPGRRYLPVPQETGDLAAVDDPNNPVPVGLQPGQLPQGMPGAPTGPMQSGLMHQDAGPVPPYAVPPPPPISTGSVPWLTGEQDAVSITAALGDPFTDTGATQMLRPYDDAADLPAEGPAPSLVRPYARTGGRTKPGHDLDLEALVVTTVNGREAWSSPLLNPEHVQVIGLCVDTTSVAEIAARLSVPIGVARVIIADMVDLGLVEVGKTSANTGDERDPAFLRRVLSGLQRL
ncbi:DUF742 domain-containing protein [Kineosporia sp. A_224]|uniref:DUF742 domain-containing protein n=1 Tax=Kineosporia sp. A_224 TaxID=1962180 RepID=UPI000B4A8DCC|nr:DUF742 domain-containing protein [Kineosporia sp. A_224]